MAVSEAKNKRVQVVTPRGEHRHYLPTALAWPSGSAVSGEHLFVAQQMGAGLQKLRLDGTLVARAGGDFQRQAEWIESALGVLVRASTVFVADVTQYRVNAYDEESLQLKFSIGAASLQRSPTGCQPRLASHGGSYAGPSCFNPHGVAASKGHGGRLFVTDPDNNCVQVFRLTGEVSVSRREPTTSRKRK